MLGSRTNEIPVFLGLKSRGRKSKGINALWEVGPPLLRIPDVRFLLTVRTLDITLSDIHKDWRVLSRGMALSDLVFKRINSLPCGQ